MDRTGFVFATEFARRETRPTTGHFNLLALTRWVAKIELNLSESAQAHIRVLVRRIFRKYGYPPDKERQLKPF